MTTWKQVAYRTWQNGDFRLRQLAVNRWRASYNASFFATGKDRARALTNLAAYPKAAAEGTPNDVARDWWLTIHEKALALAAALQEGE